jgi:hypothetical protein
VTRNDDDDDDDDNNIFVVVHILVIRSDGDGSDVNCNYGDPIALLSKK